jgi:hypothetical protein
MLEWWAAKKSEDTVDTSCLSLAGSKRVRGLVLLATMSARPKNQARQVLINKLK